MSEDWLRTKESRGASPPVQGATVLHCLARLYEIAIQGATRCNGGCYILVFWTWMLSGAWTLALGASLRVVDLRCEYLQSPLGIDEAHPRLTWRLESSERGERQTAYEILVASELGKIDSPDLWDSEKVANSQTVNIVYAGKPLTSRQRCFWKVKVWDKDGQPSDWSEPAEWTMGLLKPDDWKADYITFRDDSPIPKATNPLTLPPRRQPHPSRHHLRHRSRHLRTSPEQPTRRRCLFYSGLDRLPPTRLLQHLRRHEPSTLGHQFFSCLGRRWLVFRLPRLRPPHRHRHRTHWPLHLWQNAGADGATRNRIRRRLSRNNCH